MRLQLPFTESDYIEVAGAALLKSFSAVDIFLQILQEFRNIFLKVHLSKAAPAAFFQIKIKGFYLKSSL